MATILGGLSSIACITFAVTLRGKSIKNFFAGSCSPPHPGRGNEELYAIYPILHSSVCSTYRLP
jgi:hypothetical protein